MIEILEQQIWQGYSVEKLRITGVNGNRVPCNCIWPKDRTLPVPYMITTHGATSSKHEWTEMDGYTKGGNITQELVAKGIAVIAMDLHFHGDNNTQNMGNLNVFSEDNWDVFFSRSITDIHTVLNHFAQDPSCDSSRMGFAGYSLAGIFGFWLANRGAPFTTMLLCVPSVDRNQNKPYATFNNLDNLKNLSILQVSAEEDEYVPFAEAKWLFEQIPLTRKRFLSFKSGHSLPADYVPEAVAWIHSQLNPQ
jgi:dienelactone hydrolase